MPAHTPTHRSHLPAVAMRIRGTTRPPTGFPNHSLLPEMKSLCQMLHSVWATCMWHCQQQSFIRGYDRHRATHAAAVPTKAGSSSSGESASAHAAGRGSGSGAGPPPTRVNTASAKVPAVRMISSRIRRLRLLSSSILMYCSVSSMNSPAHSKPKPKQCPYTLFYAFNCVSTACVCLL